MVAPFSLFLREIKSTSEKTRPRKAGSSVGEAMSYFSWGTTPDPTGFFLRHGAGLQNRD